MRAIRLVCAAAALTAVIFGVAFAQPPGRQGGRGGMMMRGGGIALLLNASVQEELKLTDKQKDSFREYSQAQQEKMREMFAGGFDNVDKDKMQSMMREGIEAAEKKVKEVLNADQMKRYSQIKWQQAGVGVFNDKEVSEALKLTEAQKDKFKAMAEEMLQDINELRREAGGNFQEMQQKMTALRKETMEKAEKSLNDDQRKQLKDMLGKHFEMKMDAPMGKGGNRTKKGGDGNNKDKPKRGDG